MRAQFSITAIMPAAIARASGVSAGGAEQITGERWTIEVIRKLWEGGLTSHHGERYTVEGKGFLQFAERELLPRLADFRR